MVSIYGRFNRNAAISTVRVKRSYPWLYHRSVCHLLDKDAAVLVQRYYIPYGVDKVESYYDTN